MSLQRGLDAGKVFLLPAGLFEMRFKLFEALLVGLPGKRNALAQRPLKTHGEPIQHQLGRPRHVRRLQGLKLHSEPQVMEEKRRPGRSVWLLLQVQGMRNSPVGYLHRVRGPRLDEPYAVVDRSEAEPKAGVELIQLRLHLVIPTLPAEKGADAVSLQKVEDVQVATDDIQAAGRTLLPQPRADLPNRLLPR